MAGWNFFTMEVYITIENIVYHKWIKVLLTPVHLKKKLKQQYLQEHYIVVSYRPIKTIQNVFYITKLIYLRDIIKMLLLLYTHDSKTRDFRYDGDVSSRTFYYLSQVGQNKPSQMLNSIPKTRK